MFSEIYKFHLITLLSMLILPAIASPLTVLFMRLYLKATFSKALVESARLDGAGEFRIFNQIILPLMKPALSTIGIYAYLQCWNEFMFANVFISDSKHRTLPVGIKALSGAYTTDWGPIGAALVIATFPTLIVYIILCRRIQDSFIAGAVKG